MISALLVEVSSSGGGCAALQAAGNGVRPGVVVAVGERRVDAAAGRRRRVRCRRRRRCGPGAGSRRRRCLRAETPGSKRRRRARWPTPLRSMDAADPLIGVDRDGALFDDDLVAGEGAGDLAGDGLDVGEVGVAGLALRGADGDEDGLAARAIASARSVVNSDAAVAIAFEQLGQVMLVDQGVAALRAPRPCARHYRRRRPRVPSPQSTRGDKAHITGADHGNIVSLTHQAGSLLLSLQE